MEFTIGNLITLIVVLIVLAIYRRVDRNNRTLEKVRTYSERVRGELDTLVDERSRSIQDVGIELDVHQKAAREMLNRIRTMEQSMQERMERVDAVDRRLGEYDSAIGELLTMTENAQKNMERLHSESGYVDKLSKRIKASWAHINEIDARTPQIVEQLQQSNQAGIARLSERLDKEIEQRVGEFDSRLLSSRQEAEQTALALAAKMRTKCDEAYSTVDRVQEKLQAADSDLAKRMERFHAHIETFQQRYAAVEAEYDTRLTAAADKARAVEREIVNRLQNQFQSHAQEIFDRARTASVAEQQHLTEEIAAQGKELQTALQAQGKELRAALQTQAQELALAGATAEKQQRVELETMKTRMATVQQQVDEHIDGLDSRLVAAGAQMEQQAQGLLESARADFEHQQKDAQAQLYGDLEAIQRQQTELHQEMRDRDQQMNEAQQKIDALCDDLGTQVQQNIEQAQTLFGDFQAEIAGARHAEHERSEQEALALRAELDTIRARLEEIGQEGAGAVAAMTGKFEAELQTDLRRRSVAIEERLDKWQSTLQDNLGRIAEHTRSECEQLVRSHSEELNSSLMSVREVASARIGGVREDIEKTEQQLRLRLDSMDKLVGTTEEDTAQMIAKLKSETRETLEREVNRFQLQIGEEIGRISHESEVATGNLQGHVASTIEVIGETMRSTHDEVTTWQAQMGRTLAETAAETETAIGELTQQTDLRAREFQGIVEQTRIELGELRRNAVAQMNDESKQLQGRLSEIEKRQRAFAEQTKLFERADTLKEHLRGEIEELRAQIAGVDEQRAGVREIELNLTKTRKLMREVGERLSRFHSDRRRIDQLENSYSRLINLSERVDTRLEQITADNDSLQAIQVRMRSIETLEKSIEERYERLERKRTIVEATNAGVDKSFQDLEQVERRLQKANSDITALPKQVKQLSERLDILANSSRSADKAAEMIDGLGSLLSDIETRMERLQTTREWLGRTETRLSQIGDRTEERIKLLKALTERTSGENLPSNNGELVVKLAHQGWTVEEIAHQTKVSRGEIEVILGMAGT